MKVKDSGGQLLKAIRRETEKIGIKKTVSFLGTVLMFVAFFFLGRTLVAHGIDFSLLGSPMIVGGLILVSFVEGSGIVLASMNYHALIRNVSGIKPKRSLSMLVYTISNLYKYIPGGVMYVVGRNRIAVETEGLGHGKVAFATLVEGILIVIGAILVGIIFSFESFFIFTSSLNIFNEVMLGITLAIIVAAWVLYVFRNKIRPFAKNFWSTVDLLNIKVIAKRLGFAVALMFVWSSTFVVTMFLLGQPMNLSLAFALIGLYLLAWLAGFLTPGAPSGLGIREVVMLMFISGFVYESILLSAMVVHRVVTVIGDVFAYGLCLAITKGGKG